MCEERGIEKKKLDILQTWHLYGLVTLSIIITFPFPKYLPISYVRLIGIING